MIGHEIPRRAGSQTQPEIRAMFRSKILLAAMTAMIALGATGVAFAEEGSGEIRREVRTVLAARVSASQAIAVAERETGGRAMKIGIKLSNGDYVYEVETISKDRVEDALVDPGSGEVLGNDTEGILARIFDVEDRNDFASLSKLPTTLAKAVNTAEQKVGGRTVKAGFHDEDGERIFRVEVVKNDVLHRVVVDTATGKVVKVAKVADVEDDE
jgi:uncharacterized membrane protein YkoI